MTLTRALASGSGKLEYRLVIEGLHTEFVSHAGMETAAVAASSTPARKVGLKRDGLRINEQVDIQAGKLNVSGMTVRIADVGGYATAAFGIFPSNAAYLKEDAEVSDTTIYVTSTSGLSVNDVIHINTEAMRITSFSGEDPTLINVSRAVYSTIAQKHWTENGYNLRAPEVTKVMPSFEGRRVYLYWYSDDDILPVGTPTNGAQVFIGTITGEPRLNQSLGEWEISIGSIAKLLDQNVGRDSVEALKIRGIYYAWSSAFFVLAKEYNADTLTGPTFATGSTEGANYPFTIEGHFESNQLFAASLKTSLEAEDASFTGGGTLTCYAVDDYTIKIVYTTGGTARFCSLAMGPDFDALDGGYDFWYDTSGRPVETVVASTEYWCYLRLPYPRIRALEVDILSSGLDMSLYNEAVAEQYPENRVYLAENIPFSIDTPTAMVVRIDQGTDNPIELNWKVDAIESTERYVDFELESVRQITFQPRLRLSGMRRVIDPTNAEFTFDIVNIPVTANDVAEYLDLIVDNSATYCNLGVMPFLTTTDYDQVLSERKLDPAIANRTYATPRTYIFGKAKKLNDILAEEMKLIGCFPCLGSTGKIRYRKIQIPSASSTAQFTLTTANTLWSTLPMWERNSLGMLNQIEYQGVYNAIEDKHTGVPIVVRDVSGFGQARIAKSVSIKPYSLATNEPTFQDTVTIASEFFGMFGYSYAIVTVGVPLSVYSAALCGTIGAFTSNVLPDETDGTRGYTSEKKGLVIGRDWDLARGQGVLTMYVPFMRVGGYTPTARITARTDNGSNNWTLTVSDAQWDALSSTYYADDATLAGYFPVGASVRVYSWDNSSPTELSGIVTQLDSTTQIRVTFDGVWTPGVISTTNAWNLAYDYATDAGITTAQQGYAYIAGTDARVDFPTSAPAKVFSA